MSNFLHNISSLPGLVSPHLSTTDTNAVSLPSSAFPSLPLFPLLLLLSCVRHFTYPPLVENVQLSLVLQTENKGSVVTGGELNVCLDGMVVDLGSLPNGSTAADSESHLYHTHSHTTYKHRGTHDELHVSLE